MWYERTKQYLRAENYPREGAFWLRVHICVPASTGLWLVLAWPSLRTRNWSALAFSSSWLLRLWRQGRWLVSLLLWLVTFNTHSLWPGERPGSFQWHWQVVVFWNKKIQFWKYRNVYSTYISIRPLDATTYQCHWNNQKSTWQVSKCWAGEGGLSTGAVLSTSSMQDHICACGAKMLPPKDGFIRILLFCEPVSGVHRITFKTTAKAEDQTCTVQISKRWTDKKVVQAFLFIFPHFLSLLCLGRIFLVLCLTLSDISLVFDLGQRLQTVKVDRADLLVVKYQSKWD